MTKDGKALNSEIESLEQLLRQSSDDDLLADVEIRLTEEVVEVSRDEALIRLVSCKALERDPDLLQRSLAGGAGLLLCGIAPEGLTSKLRTKGIINLLETPDNPEALLLEVDSMLKHVQLKHESDSSNIRARRYWYELSELVEIARAITQERDLDTLLGLALEKSRFVTGADAGSIYVVDDHPDNPDERLLRFKLSQNDSLEFESSEFVMPVSHHSIAGSCVLQAEAIDIADVCQLDDDVPYEFDGSFDERVGYISRSILTVPLVSAEDEVIGVIQLINKKRNPSAKLSGIEDVDREVIGFDERSKELLGALASQAGIALENALLYDEIHNIFEGFVMASVEAIEQRDPTTSGHSQRVSLLSCGLAELIDRSDEGPFQDFSLDSRQMQELKYASLLHDFGKIGIREEVLTKAKKLYPGEQERVRQRVAYAIKVAETEALQEKIDVMKAGGGSADLKATDERFHERRRELEKAWELIIRANEPTVLAEGDFSQIPELSSLTYPDMDGQDVQILSSEEVVALSINRGSLSPTEMDEIRSHVAHTFNFLSKIPWGRSMSQIPRIAGAHHERLNGRGYPKGLTEEQIPLRSKIIAVADVYDALTARDRPYKRAVPQERAIQILGFEAKDGLLNADMVRIFVEAKVFRITEGDLGLK